MFQKFGCTYLLYEHQQSNRVLQLVAPAGYVVLQLVVPAGYVVHFHLIKLHRKH